MCGWACVLGATATSAELQSASQTLASRGPDGAGERIVDEGPLRAGLAHRRLAILDPSPAGAQPMYDSERGVSVVYNGEIYNSPQLRRELQSLGVRFRSSCDTEVLLLGWAEWGDAILERIEGIFSFALLDERRGRALLARDRLGVKPLYWALDGEVVVAASAPRAILSLRPRLRSGIDRVALAQFLTLLWVPHPRTPWTGIRKLPPGSAVSVEPGSVREWRYWSPPEPGETRLDPAVLAKALEAATSRQLLSDVPVGLLFSGGLDSTLLLAFMAGFYAEAELHAVTAGYDDASQRFELAPDDVGYARQAAAGYPQMDLREVVVDQAADVDLDEFASHFDDPVADPAAISLYRLAKASDTKVMLSGVGGEELFAGYPRHLSLGVARRAARLPAPARRMLSAASPGLYGARPGPLYGFRRNAQKLARALGELDPPHYWRMMAQLTRAEAEGLVPGVAGEAFGELDAETVPLASASLADALAFDRNQFLPNLNLAYVDKAGMAASVEVRVPFLDETVLTTSLGCDASTFIEGGVTKAPLRAAARGHVDQAIIDRPKSGFGGPSRAWFQGPRRHGLRERVDAAADAGLVERGPANRIFEAAASGRRDAALAAWALVCLQVWHDHHAIGGRDADRRGHL